MKRFSVTEFWNGRLWYITLFVKLYPSELYADCLNCLFYVHFKKFNKKKNLVYTRVIEPVFICRSVTKQQ